MDLAGRVAIVTGGGSGIGAATARALAGEGAQVVLAGRHLDSLAAVAGEIEAAGGSALTAPTDVRDEAQVNALVDRTLQAFGRVDILVNSAGLSPWINMDEMTAAVWDETLGVNLRGAFLAAKAVWPHMRGQRSGQIFNISSVASFQPYEGQAAYCASKYGLNGLTVVLALEGQPHNIRAYAICPAATETAVWQGQASPEVQRRMMRPEDVAEAIRWLAVQPARLAFGPVVIRNLRDPWESPEGPG
jgi:3-oxoacyl-[acyl-carrier protein] reductase